MDQTMQPTGVIDAIYNAVDNAPTALARVARYIAQNPDRVVNQSIAELARSAESGQATILRLCQSIGFEGFRDFKLELAREIERDKALRLAHLPEAPATPRHTRLHGIANALQTALADSANLIQPARIDALAKALKSASRVELFGVGVSALCADLIASRLVWLGIPANVPRSGLIASGLAATFDRNVVAVGISYTGVTEETVAFIERARASRARTVAITTRADFPLATAAHDKILLSRSGPWPEAGSARLVPSITLLTEFLADRLQQL